MQTTKTPDDTKSVADLLELYHHSNHSKQEAVNQLFAEHFNKLGEIHKHLNQQSYMLDCQLARTDALARKFEDVRSAIEDTENHPWVEELVATCDLINLEANRFDEELKQDLIEHAELLDRRLEEAGITRITPAVGSQFLASEHQPLQKLKVDSRDEHAQIRQVFSSGFKVNGNVKKFAQVAVSTFYPTNN